MTRKLTRKEELELLLKGISLPVYIIKIKQYGKWWKPSEYEELAKMINAELALMV